MICNSPDCAGCYEVARGVHLHPPKNGVEYQRWTERWNKLAEERARREKRTKKLKQKKL
jgi:hypothetical protein